MIDKRFLLSLVTLAGLVQTNLASAQQVVHPVTNDSSLYGSFFFVMEDFSAWLDARGVTVPANRTKLMQSAARYLHIDVSELPKVSATCQSFAATIRRINTNARSYVDSSVSGKKLPEPALLRGFEAQRQAAIQSGISQLRQQLSVASWNGLTAHINGEHRNSIQVKFPVLPVPPPGTAH